MAAGIAVMAITMAGCASDQHTKYNLNDEVMASKVPAFLTGPASVLLTNENGFSALLTLEQFTSSNKVQVVTGQLLGQSDYLLFAPRGSDRIFVWNAHEHRGYVFSEALQGYAPIGSSFQVTRLSTTAEVASQASGNVNGHAGREVEVAVAANDGSTANFKLWCASDLKDFPVQLAKVNGPESFVINLTNFRFETLNPEIFRPPEDFTKYVSLDAMTDELVLRRAKSKLKVNVSTSSPDKVPMAAPSGIK